MADLNKVMVIGRLTKDVILKYTKAGTPIGSGSIAVNRNVKTNDGWANEASFFDINIWGKLAENLNQYLTKGKQIAIEGELKQQRWQDNDGSSRSRVIIDVKNLQLLGGNDNSQNNNQQYNQNSQQQNAGYQQQPQQQRPSAYQPGGNGNAGNNGNGQYQQQQLDNFDDIPF